MAETKDQEETALHTKRKPDPTCEDQADFPNKSQKLQPSGHNSQAQEAEISLTEEEKVESDPEVEDEEESEEEDDEESKGVDRKGKGIMRDDKGKGILIEEDDEDDSSGSEFEDGDSDLSDDPLAEVDLDNILPSRTRRRQVQPGVYIRNQNNQEDDSDDSDGD